jgi:ferritin
MAELTNRRITYLSKKIADLLIAQVTHEKQNNLSYLNAATWCDTRGLVGNYEYFKTAADGELEHSEIIYHHLLESNYDFEIADLKPQPLDIKEGTPKTMLQELHESVLTREIQTTTNILAICKACLEEGDYITFNAMQPLVIEQREEENKATTVLDQFEFTEDLIILDNRIRELK